MKRNNFFSRFIVVTLTVALLLISGSRAIPVSALAVGPLADPVYDTEIVAFKDYVEQNLDQPQLDIMFFLMGGLAVAQLGAQDAQLITPYPNEENVKEWLINCGIQLYNSVIGLVPSGDYYMGIPSIGSAGTKGVPRQVIKALVAQMMGDAVVAINYQDLDEFLEENPNELYIPFNRDLQLGINAVFGLNGGAYDWQITQRSWSNGNFQWFDSGLSGTALDEYNSKVSSLAYPHYLASERYSNNLYWYRGIVIHPSTDVKFDLFINTTNHTVSFHNAPSIITSESVYSYRGSSSYINYGGLRFITETYDPNSFNSYQDIATYYLNFVPENYSINPKLVRGFTSGYGYPSAYSNAYFANYDFVNRVMVGPTWESATEIQNMSDLNYGIDNLEYYQQVTNDYLLDIRGLIGDLVNYVYVRQPVFDNIHDLEGNNVVPILVKISTELENITDLIAPPLPVNMNDIAELTDNTYLERVKEHARNAGDIFANYVAFWHNCDSDLVYTMFGAAILVLVGAFVGKWGHS